MPGGPPSRRLLLVDDEEAILRPVSLYFRRLGWSAVATPEPEEAEALVEHEHFDAIILDLALTRFGREGLEVLATVRALDHRVPVIIMSAHITPEVEDEARRLGADAVLRKPQPLAEVASLVERLAAGRA